MTNQETRSQSEAEIRQFLDSYLDAIRAKDIDAITSVYAPEFVAFDIVPPLRYVGAQAYTKPWQDLFDRYEDPIRYELRDLSITAGDDVAFSHSLNHLNGTMKNGQKTDMWLRWTVGYRKINGKWMIAHMQVSVPADLANGKPAVDLKP